MWNDIQPNANAFAAALDDLGEKIERDVFDKVIKKVLFDLLALVVRETPKDTGRASAAWMLEQDWSEWVLPEGNYRGADMTGKLAEVMAGLPDSDHYVLFNNVEYISALENGHSQQAPAGFIAQALGAIGEYVNRAASAAGYEATS